MSIDQKISMSPEQFEAMMSRLLSEARKPADPTPEELAAKESELSMRRQQAELVLQEQESRRIAQANCIHMRRDNTTLAVYVADGNYLICQACQGIIRPGVRPDGVQSNDIYDTNLFNRIFQLAASPAVF